MALPLQAPATGLTWASRPPINRILSTGAAGTVASLITAGFSQALSWLALILR